MKTYRSAREVLEAVEQVLAAKPRLAEKSPTLSRQHQARKVRGSHRESPLEQIAKQLESSRRYFAVTIYLVAGERAVRVASAGPAPRCEAMRIGEGNVGEAAKTGVAKVVPDVSRDPQYVNVFSETRSELVTPIKIGAHIIGVIDVESIRLNGFAYNDRVLLQRVARVVAKFLSNAGKYLVMKAREAEAGSRMLREQPAGSRRYGGEVSPKQPKAERQEPMRAAAGEKVRS